jgi:hypothetical protein
VINEWTTDQWEHHRQYIDEFFLKIGAANGA